MKLKKYFWGLCTITMLTCVSCDTDNEREIYQNTTDGITFLSDEQEAYFPEGSEDLSFSIDVVRQNGEGKLTVGLINNSLEKNGNQFTPKDLLTDIQIPESVTFNDGERMASIPVVLAKNITQGEELYVSVALDTDQAPMDAHMQKIVTIYCDYTYTQVGQRKYISEWLSPSHATDTEVMVKVEKADQQNWYRVQDLYEKGYSIIFEIADDNKVTVEETAGGKNVTVSGEGTYDPAQNVINVTLTIIAADQSGEKKKYTVNEKLYLNE
ncbi:hypothetical protein [Phocaeicola plebeius]|mgnify:FL=1|jgi:hypothetical protein|uniref:hypothetical protein n=1 Tax=Phocaeicola plebeius TaxID=310297 RepID=UPI0026F01C9D|nr:hypothetical protein [Phocaeicola plebeius]